MQKVKKPSQREIIKDLEQQLATSRSTIATLQDKYEDVRKQAIDLRNKENELKNRKNHVHDIWKALVAANYTDDVDVLYDEAVKMADKMDQPLRDFYEEVKQQANAGDHQEG